MVGQFAVIHDLQQDVEHIRMRLFDLVEQQHRMGVLVDRVGQQAALVEPDIAGRCADQTRDRMAFHVFRHIETRQFHAERIGELAGDLGLADTGRAGEQVRADRLVRFAQPGTGELDGRCQRIDGAVLAEDHTFEIGIQRLERLLVGARHAFRGDAGDLGDHGLDILDRDQLLAPAFRHQHLGRADLVDHVDRLIGQLAVVDILGRQFHRAAQGSRRVAHPVMLFVIGLQAAQNLDRVFHARFGTSIFWNRRTRARSFSKYERYSLYVVEPMHFSVPPCRAGFSRFDASIEPPLVAPAPMTVWISSINSTASSCCSSSVTTALRRSSKSPR